MNDFYKEFLNETPEQKEYILQTVAKFVCYDTLNDVECREVFMKALLEPQIEALTEKTVKGFIDPYLDVDRNTIYEQLPSELINKAKDLVADYLIDHTLPDFDYQNMNTWLNENVDNELFYAVSPMKEEIDQTVQEIVGCDLNR